MSENHEDLSEEPIKDPDDNQRQQNSQQRLGKNYQALILESVFNLSSALKYAAPANGFTQLAQEPEPEYETTFNAETRFEWTFPKAALVELIYALKSAGCVNEGRASVKTITEKFERLFGVRIENPTRTFQEIQIRKNGYAKFIDQLKDSLVRQIDGNDDR